MGYVGQLKKQRMGNGNRNLQKIPGQRKLGTHSKDA